MSNARKLAANLPTEGSLSGRNIIINGNFTISQRGSYTSSTSVSDGTFYLDRWEYTEDGSPSSSLIHNSDGSVKITTGASVTGSSRLRQKFEYTLAPRQYDGKTFTVSAKVKSNTANARINVYAGGYLSLTGTTAHSGGGSYETLTATFTTPSTISTEFSVHIGIDGASSANVSITSGQYFEVKEVQMEVGPQSTPFEHEPVGVTLSKCQRYYYKWSSSGLSDNIYVRSPYVSSAPNSSASASYTFPVTMRANPTMGGTAGLSLNRFTSSVNNAVAQIGSSSSSNAFALTAWQADAEL